MRKKFGRIFGRRMKKLPCGYDEMVARSRRKLLVSERNCDTVC
jgi:hypothetical protein